MSGIPYRSMQNYLRGEREPNTEALTQIRTRLSISIDWLLTGYGSALAYTLYPFVCYFPKSCCARI